LHLTKNQLTLKFTYFTSKKERDSMSGVEMLFRRSRLKQAAVHAVGSLLGALRAPTDQLPKGFWQNPYALGFIHGWALGAAQVTLSPNNLLRTPTREDASHMILAIYEAYLPKEQVVPILFLL